MTEQLLQQILDRLSAIEADLATLMESGAVDSTPDPDPELPDLPDFWTFFGAEDDFNFSQHLGGVPAETTYKFLLKPGDEPAVGTAFIQWSAFYASHRQFVKTWLEDLNGNVIVPPQTGTSLITWAENEQGILVDRRTGAEKAADYPVITEPVVMVIDIGRTAKGGTLRAFRGPQRQTPATSFDDY